jgi:hypothetical protein
VPVAILLLSCGRTVPSKSETAAAAGGPAAPSSSPQSEVHTASGTSTVKTIKVLQYNVKEGNKSKGQTCCWFDPGIRSKEQALIVEEMTNQGVELASLIESDNDVNGVYNCSSLDDLLGQKLNSLASQCTLCSFGLKFKEALHLVWNTKKWNLIKGYDPSGDTCFGNDNGSFAGRPFAAVLLRNVQDPNSEVVFIGVHPGHPFNNEDFEEGAKPIWDAYNKLMSASTHSPKLIISCDFNLTCKTAVQQITDSSQGAVSIDPNQCSSPSPQSCCCDQGFVRDFDHVFTNLPSAKVSTVIPASYTGPFTPNSCPNTHSEEHKPVVATIAY